MRQEPNNGLDKYRASHPKVGKTPDGTNFGYFIIPGDNTRLDIRIISSGSWPQLTKWEHVSVSLGNRTPTWEEMVFIKNLFWSEGETVVQFHPKEDKRKNLSPFCLHMWKMNNSEYELPPEVSV